MSLPLLSRSTFHGLKTMSVSDEMKLSRLEKAVEQFGGWVDDESAPERTDMWVLRHALMMLDGIRELGLIELKMEQIKAQR
jgi:hypothetical protein